MHIRGGIVAALFVTTAWLGGCSDSNSGGQPSSGTGGAGSTGTEPARTGGAGAPTSRAPDPAVDPVTSVEPTREAGVAVAVTVSDGAASLGCNTLTNVAAIVTPTNVAGAVPELTGGAIEDGLYAETKSELYGPDAGVGVPERSTIQIAAGNIDEVLGLGASEVRYHSAYSTTGSQIEFNTSCDSSFAFFGKWSGTYQATPTTFVYAFQDGGGYLVKTYTKQ